MPTSTTRYSYQKPSVGGDTDNWGNLLNANWDSVDSNLYTVQTTANDALPKAGGAMTGDITHASDFTIDCGGDITLSADGDQVKMDDGTTTRFQVDTATGDVTMTDSDDGTELGPELKLHRDSVNPGASDVLGAVTFAGEDDGGNEVDYAQIQTVATVVTDGSEDGDLLIRTMNAGTLTTALTVKSDGDVEVGNGKYIGSTTTPTAIQIEADGDVVIAEDIIIGDAKYIGSSSTPTAIQIEADGDVKVAGDIIVNDIVMQNDRGHYRLVEEEDFIKIINEKTGKSYRLLMEEIDA